MMHRDIEHSTQVACVRWFRYAYPDRLIFAIPNGGARSAITGARLRDEGVTAGVPDLFICVPCGEFLGLFVEMKTPPGKMSASQKQVVMQIEREGYKFAVCRSFDEFRQIVTDYMRIADTGQM